MDDTEQIRRRINFAIIETGKIVFMCKIRTKLENKDLKDFLNDPTNKQKIEVLKTDNVLTQEQFELLYTSSPDVPELEQFDIALLIVLIRTFFCSVPHDDKIWNKGNKPDLNDTSLEADIVRLRNVKNDIQEQEEEQYDEIWTNIYEILLRIGSDIPDLQTKLDAYKDTSRILSPEEEDEVHKVLLQWNDMERAFEPGFDLSPSDAKTMQMKLYSLIVDGGCIVFKSLLDDLIPPNSLQHLINNNRALIDQLHRRQIIDFTQYNILFPSVGSPTSKDFDISLFTIIFRNFCGLKASSDPIWDARIPPVPTDNSKEADIVRIRNCRNEIFHLSKTSAITKEVFESKWDDITQVLVRLKGTGLDHEQMKEEIDRLKSYPLDPKKANELEKELETWIKMDEKIQQNIIKLIQKHSLCEAAIGTILRRRKVRFTDDEILLILRAYLAHPSKWIDVIAEVKANQHVLDEHTRELYAHSSDKQLRERMSTKLHSLMSKNQNEFNNVDIRQAVLDIRLMETRLVARPVEEPAAPVIQQRPVPPAPAPAQEPAEAAGPARPEVPLDPRDQIAAQMSGSDQEDMPEMQQARRRKRPLAELVRENHELYNKFLKKKMPKILREINISSSESD